MQASQQSPGQVAAAETGKAEFFLQLSSTRGEENDGLVDKLVDAVSDTGAEGVTTGLFIFDVPVNGVDARTSLQEMDWSMDPFPGRFTLIDGHMPENPGDVVVTTELAAQLDDPGRVSIGNGETTLRVVGVVKDDFFRDDSFGYVAPGTWDNFDSIESKYDLYPSVMLFWSGSTPGAVAAAVAHSLASAGQAADVGELVDSVVDRPSAERDTANPYSEVFFLLLLAPLIAGFVSAWNSTGFIGRIRDVLLSIGIVRTRLVALVTVVGATMAASIAGALLGLSAGLLFRPVLDYLATTSLGPLHDLPLYIGVVFAAAIVGAMFGSIRPHRSPAKQESVRIHSRIARFTPTAPQLLPVAAIVVMVIGVLCTQASDLNIQIASAYVFGFAFVLSAPLLFVALARWSPGSPAVVLGLRRLRGTMSQSSWTVVGIATILMLAFTLMTLYSSSISSANARTASDVPPGQAHFAPPDSFADAEELMEQIEQYTGQFDAVSFERAAGFSAEQSDGSVLVFEDYDALSRLLDIELSPEQISALEEGAVLRPKPPKADELSFVADGDSSMTLPIIVVDDIGPSYRQYGGFMLASTAESLSLGGVRRTWAYTNVSEEQARMFNDVPQLLGFDRRWIETFSPPEAHTEPPEITFLGLGIGAIAGLIMCMFAASASRALRPNLASLRALGMPRRWLAGALSAQIGVVLLLAVAVSTFASVGATLIAIALWMKGASLFFPWASIGAVVSTLLAVTVVAITVATRRLSVTERMSAR